MDIHETPLAPIPRMIHQTWKTAAVLPNLQPCQKTWLDFHPGWRYVLWTDADIDRFIRDEFPNFYQYFKSYPHHIQRVDAFRYFLLFKHGGIYADLDMQCLACFEPLLRKYGGAGLILGQENQQHKDGMMRVGNGLMISSPGHPFWLRVFEELVNRHGQSTQKLGSVFTTTGPSFLHEVYRKHPQGVTVLPSSAFCPIQWHEPKPKIELVSRRQFPQSWAAHHWSGVWREAPKEFRMLIPNTDTVFTVCIPRKKSRGHGIIERTLEAGDSWRPKLVAAWSEALMDGDYVVSVHTYSAALLLPLAHFVGPKGTVYSFQPDTNAREMLAESLRANPDLEGHVQLDPRGVTAQHVRLHRSGKWNPRKPHRSIWRPNRPSALEIVEGVPLDSMQFQTVQLIHIEANGEEHDVLAGARQLILHARPIITAEIWTDQKRQQFGTQLTQAQTFGILHQLGYTVQMLEGDMFVAMPN